MSRKGASLIRWYRRLCLYHLHQEDQLTFRNLSEAVSSISTIAIPYAFDRKGKCQIPLVWRRARHLNWDLSNSFHELSYFPPLVFGLIFIFLWWSFDFLVLIESTYSDLHSRFYLQFGKVFYYQIINVTKHFQRILVDLFHIKLSLLDFLQRKAQSFLWLSVFVFCFINNDSFLLKIGITLILLIDW